MWGLLLTLLTKLTPLLFTFGNVIVGFVAVPIFKSIQKHWVAWLIGGLIFTNLTTGLLLYNGRNDLSIEKASHARDIKSYKDAKEQAEDKIEETKRELKEEAQANATEADKDYAALNARYRASLVRYKALESVRSGPASGQPSNPPQSSIGPNRDTELPAQLTISGDDARICAVNTARLQALQAWANTLAGTK